MFRSLTFVFLVWFFANLHAQDTVKYYGGKENKETALTIGYNYNFGDKVAGERPEALHFIELGIWKSRMWRGHHPVQATYYAASDVGLNTDDFIVGPKIGGFFSLLIMGVGAELCYYTDFNSGSLRLIPSLGLFTPYFKLTVNPHVVITNKEFQSLNNGHVNLTVRVFKIKDRHQ